MTQPHAPVASGEPTGNSEPRKKLGYKERCDEKRQVDCQALAEKHATGKKIVAV